MNQLINDETHAAEFSRLLSLIRPCTMCNIPPPARPVVSGRFGAKVMSVGQCPGLVESLEDRPFSGPAGRTLFSWLESTGISEEEFRANAYMTAVTKCYPAPDRYGKRETPLPREVLNCARYLVSELRIIRPEVILAIGGMAISRLLGDMKLTDAVGKTFIRRYHSFDATVIPLPHPSGRSTWLSMGDNKTLLASALRHAGRLCAPLLK